MAQGLDGMTNTRLIFTCEGTAAEEAAALRQAKQMFEV